MHKVDFPSLSLSDRQAHGDCGTHHLSHASEKHSKQFLESMCLLYKRHELCDVTLCVGSHRIPAHKVVLSACSPYFRAMFTGKVTGI
mgnify:CR=1